MHLRVTDLERSVKFYHEKLGLDVKAYIPQIGAAFLSAGGYHHHMGLNTWHSREGSPHRTGYSGLDSFTFIVPDRHIVEELAAVLDNTHDAIVLFDMNYRVLYVNPSFQKTFGWHSISLLK